MNWRTAGVWVLRLIPAILLLQTLYFKFTGQPESVRLFTAIHMEPWGRIGTGVIELFAAVLLLIPRYTGYGALLGMAMMTGAIYFHLTKIGIYFGGDPLLFIYAVLTFIFCAGLTFIYKEKLQKSLGRS